MDESLQKRKECMEWNPELTRRHLLQWAGRAAISAAFLSAGLLASEQAGKAQRIRQIAPSPVARGRLGLPPPPPVHGDQLPYWGDGAGWNNLGSYDTIQCGDINDDGIVEMIGRTSNGILVNKYDAYSGQWLPLPAGPGLSNKGGWNNPQYYATLRLADIDKDGADELLARDAANIIVWKYLPYTDSNGNSGYQWVTLSPANPPLWPDGGTAANPTPWNQPQYYSTIQCADINGDGRVELLGRDAYGMQVWQFTSADSADTNSEWTMISRLDQFTDNLELTHWNAPQYYTTIQCADIDGDGHPELMGRGVNGMVFWHCDAANNWTPMALMPPANVWSDGETWNQPQYYSTIQCADIDGHKQAELLERARDGLDVWQFNPDPTHPANNPWVRWTTNTDLSDIEGFNHPEYYTTIQCADIDGDGAAEVLARGIDGMLAWKYIPGDPDPSQGQWVELAPGPAWSDAKGWNQVQYYSTIQTCAPLKQQQGGPPTPAVLMGRSALCIETWQFVPAANYSPNTNPPYQGVWQNTSPVFPAWTAPSDAGKLAAYDYINTALSADLGPNADLRSVYFTHTNYGDFSTWASYISDLPGTPINGVPLPTGPNQPTPEDWQAVINELCDHYDPVSQKVLLGELTLAGNIRAWQDSMHDWIADTFQNNFGALAVIGNILKPPSGNSTTMTVMDGIVNAADDAVSIIAPEYSTVANAAASIFGMACQTLAQNPSLGQPSPVLLGNLDIQFMDNLTAAQLGNETATQNILSDLGMMRALGPGYANWNSILMTQLQIQATLAYSVWLWQQVAPTIWWRKNSAALPSYYSDLDVDGAWLLDTSDLGSNGLYWYLTVQTVYQEQYPNANVLEYVFGQGDYQEGGTDYYQKLNVPITDIAYNQNGWNLPLDPTSAYEGSDVQSTWGGAPPGMRIDFQLLRDSQTHRPVVQIVLTNNLGAHITNVELTSVLLQYQPCAESLPTPRIRMDWGDKFTYQLRFPQVQAPTGTRAVLQIRGQYKDGTFGGSYRVVLP